MKLENKLTIPVPPAEAWLVLLDLERVAPCVPGAALTSREGDVFAGLVKVKLGPIALSYSGTVTFISKDEDARVAVLQASGRETRGNGTAKATVTCRLVGSGGTTDVAKATDVLVETDLAITGKPAQFGRGALAEVAGALIGQFAANLAAEISASGSAPPSGAAPAPEALDGAPPAAVPAPPPAAPAPPSSEPINLLDVAGGGAAKRVGPIVAGTTLLLAVLLLRRYLARRAARAVPPTTQ